ncbi:hypothetical protein KKG48_02940 [Patescibacteria group bacterium]|nr:hypothetical protein [Patescibacteria group bacterium]MCG2694897.1 hypothetical protein [Candidatus Parcubacteria bacterium]
MNWNRFFMALVRFFGAVIFFFGRLLRDIILEIWRGTRRIIVRWSPLAVTVVSVVIFYKLNPRGAEALLQLILVAGIMIYGFKLIISSFFGKKKK